MTKPSVLLAMLVLGCLAAPAAAQPAVENGDFETDANLFATWPGYYGFYTPPASTGFPAGTNPMDITGWMHMGGGGLVPGMQPGNPDGTFRDNGVDSAGNLTNVAFIQGTGSIAQQISNFNVGSDYQLDFDYNARDCCGDFPMMTVTIGDLGVGGHTFSYMDNFIMNVDPNGVHMTPWYHGRISFRADTDTLNLMFSSQTVNGGDGTLIIDNVAIAATTP
jgi:hypothetical protein